ncbi:ATP-binding protein, partial [Nocardioides sp.]|uniref:ATP-binding protein n=1 Tax=Nocardioides sp. TaxID=35761 RepID=UPI002736B0A5
MAGSDVPPRLLEREHELADLASAIGEATAGHGRVVLIHGEAGIGKSSLLTALGETLPPGARLLVGYCDDLATKRTLGPFRDLAGKVGVPLAEAVSGGADRDRVLTELTADLASPSRPTVLAIEDVHWADEATLDVLRYLARRLARLPVALLL